MGKVSKIEKNELENRQQKQTKLETIWEQI